MLYKYSLKFLLSESADLKSLKQNMKHYQGRISEIFAIQFLKDPNLDPLDFIPSMNIGEDAPFLTLPGGDAAEGDWKKELVEIYKLMSARKDIKEIDALFSEYLSAAQDLAGHISSYMESSNLGITGYKWTGKSLKQSGTADVILDTVSYMDGVHLSLKSTLTNYSSMNVEEQTLGLYEDYQIDTTTDARAAVKEMIPDWEAERQAFITKHNTMISTNAGPYRNVEQNAEFEASQDRAIQKLESEVRQLEYQIDALKDAANKSKMKKKKDQLFYSYLNGGWRQEDIVKDSGYQRALAEIERNQKEAKAKSAPLKSERTKKKNKIDKIKTNIKRQILADIFREQAGQAGFKAKPEGTKVTTTDLLLKAPFFNSRDDLVLDSTSTHCKDDWRRKFHSTCERLNEAQILKELRGPKMIDLLVTKFIQRQLTPEGSSLHLIFHSRKGLVPKTDMDVLKEFLRDQGNLKVIRYGSTFHVKATGHGTDSDGDATEWSVLSVSPSVTDTLERPSFEVKPTMKPG